MPTLRRGKVGVIPESLDILLAHARSHFGSSLSALWLGVRYDDSDVGSLLLIMTAG